MKPSSIRGIGMTSQRTRERLVQRLREEGVRNPIVLEAVRTTPRHLFVDEALESRAYDDIALPIGHGQTISQPYIVARMTELVLGSIVPDKVLEIGTGSGYQTALLAQLVPRVYTVERLGALLQSARRKLNSLQLRNVRFRHGDGAAGWIEHAPYPAILVTAAPETLPMGLLEQLEQGGRLVLPLGQRRAQVLSVITRTTEGYDQVDLEPVSFVPLLGGMS